MCFFLITTPAGLASLSIRYSFTRLSPSLRQTMRQSVEMGKGYANATQIGQAQTHRHFGDAALLTLGADAGMGRNRTRLPRPNGSRPEALSPDGLRSREAPFPGAASADLVGEVSRPGTSACTRIVGEALRAASLRVRATRTCLSCNLEGRLSPWRVRLAASSCPAPPRRPFAEG